MRSVITVSFALLTLAFVQFGESGLPVAMAGDKGVRYPKQIVGVARVVDGDTLHIGKVKIRLHGIDAPERNQRCGNWACGMDATEYLKRLIANDAVTCEGEKYDRYKRLIGICYLGQGRINLNAIMVASGLARAYDRYSKDYLSHDAVAQKTKSGMWSKPHVPPWEYRRNRRRAKR